MKVSEILIGAKALIVDEQHWCQKSYAKNIEGYATRIDAEAAFAFCTYGALNLFIDKNKIPRQYLRECEECLESVARPLSMVQYNDRHTHDEVMAKWDEAIALAIKDYDAITIMTR